LGKKGDSIENFRNASKELKDIHIKVEKGVEANIIFDGAQIQNNQMYDSGVDSCGNIYTNQLFPVLDIEGTANLYVEEDSCLTSPDKDYSYVIQVTGDMTLKEGNGRLTLMLGNCKEDSEEEENYGYSILGRKGGRKSSSGNCHIGRWRSGCLWSN